MSDKDNYASKRYMKLEEPPLLQDRKIWRGIHRGINFDIENFKIGESRDFKNSWVHYIIFDLEQLPDDLAPKFWLETKVRAYMDGGRVHVTHDYGMSDEISALDFHGGCTYYSKVIGQEGGPKVVKIGCDYQHSWDMGESYDMEYVYSEVKTTVESLYKLAFGKIKIRSWGDGKYRLLEEFE